MGKRMKERKSRGGGDVALSIPVPAIKAASAWCEAKDPKTGKTYYYNKETKESSWTKPAGL